MPGSNDPNTGIIEEFRANGGKVGGYFEGATLLILHTKGVKTGLARIKLWTSCWTASGSWSSARRVVRRPIRTGANTSVMVESSVEPADRVVAVRAVEITGPSAGDELYARQVERRPGFAEYKRTTSRRIPRSALDPVAALPVRCPAETL